MAKEKVINIEDLIQDKHNFNKGTEEGQALIDKSFQELGAGRSILLDKDDQIIAGNKSQKGAIKSGIRKVRIIETDGTELIAVKRTDVSIDSELGRKLAAADNATAKANIVFDESELNYVAEELGIDFLEWGIDLSNISAPVDDTEAKEDDFDETQDEVETKVKFGEMWGLGNHRLLCGDSTNPDTVKSLMGGGKMSNLAHGSTVQCSC